MRKTLEAYKQLFTRNSVSVRAESQYSPAMNPESGIRLEVKELIQLSKLAERGTWEKPTRIQSRLGGLYLSRHKGRGMEYEETRLYEPGDDVRHINWRVTARTGCPHTKLFREERERPVMFFLDLNRSMYFGTQRRFKAVQAIRAATLFGWEALQRGDRIGSVCVAGNEHLEFKPSATRKFFLRQLHEIIAMHNLQLKPLYKSSWHYQTTTDIYEGLARLAKVVPPGSRVRIFSDGMGLDDNSYQFLRRLCMHHEVSFILVLDPLETHLPRFGRFRVSDGAEMAWMEGGSQKQRDSYDQSCQLHFKRVERELNQLGVDVKRLSSADELIAKV